MNDPHRHVLTSALTGGAIAEVDLNAEGLNCAQGERFLFASDGIASLSEDAISRQLGQAGDAFLLCSDGFWEPVLEADMEACLAANPDPGEWLGEMGALLRRRMAPDHDNYSALGISSIEPG